MEKRRLTEEADIQGSKHEGFDVVEAYLSDASRRIHWSQTSFTTTSGPWMTERWYGWFTSHVRLIVPNSHPVGSAVETRMPNSCFYLGGTLDGWTPLGSNSQVFSLHILHRVPNGR